MNQKAREQAEEAVVLRMTNVGEADRIVTLLGRRSGKISAIAKSARKSQRRFPGMSAGVVGLAISSPRKGAQIERLESFEVTVNPNALDGDLARTAHTAYCMELVDRLTPDGQADDDIFLWTAHIVHEMKKPASAIRLRVFELGLLRRLGLYPVFEQCVICGRDDLGTETCAWEPELGGVVCKRCPHSGRPLSGQGRQRLVAWQSLSLNSSGVEALAGAADRDARNALQDFIQHQVGAPLKSVQFIAKLQGL